MGYEVKLYFGKSSDYLNEKKAEYFQIVGMVDLCKPYEGEFNVLNSYRNTGKFPDPPNSVKFITKSKKKRYIKSYAFIESGDKESFEDKYSTALYSYPAQEILDALKHDNAKEPYRRYAIAIAALEVFIKEFEGEEPRVLLWGH